MGGGHSHDDAAGGSSPRTRVLLAAALAPFVLATVVGLIVLWPSASTSAALEGAAPDDLVRAVIVSSDRGPCTDTPDDAGITCNSMVARLLETTADVTRRRCPIPGPGGGCAVAEEWETIAGLDAGEVTALPEHSEAGSAPRLEVGDEVVLGYFAAAGEGFQLSFASPPRSRPSSSRATRWWRRAGP